MKKSIKSRLREKVRCTSLPAPKTFWQRMDYIEDEKVPQHEPVGWRARLAESRGRRARTIATRLPAMPEAAIQTEWKD